MKLVAVMSLMDRQETPNQDLLSGQNNNWQALIITNVADSRCVRARVTVAERQAKNCHLRDVDEIKHLEAIGAL